MSKTNTAKRRKVKTVHIGCPFTASEVASIDAVAARINPACPKRTEGMRHLLMLGYEEFLRLNAPAKTVQPAAPAET